VTPDSIEAAYAACEAFARSHHENFPIVSRFLPKARRHHLWAIYAFARTADDFADEAPYSGRRLEALDDWERRLDEALAGRPEGPIFVALADTVRRCDLAAEPLRRLLEAFRMDVAKSRHADWESLQHYCARSADPVGRLVLGVFGYRDPELLSLSDAICTGLQLANFWQDVAVDLRKDRIYLPEADRVRHGVSEQMLAAGDAGPAFRALLAEMIERTRARFDEGRSLPDRVGSDLAFHLRLVWLGGVAILDRIEAAGHDVFRKRPTLSTRDRLAIMGRALARPLPPAARPPRAGSQG
jgi:squalene synthase HpnC